MTLECAAKWLETYGPQACDGDRKIVIGDRGDVQGGWDEFPPVLPEYRQRAVMPDSWHSERS